MLKNEKIRLALFVFALVCAVFFITRGVYLITNQKPGFYNIEAAGDKDAPVYAKGINLTFYLEGRSNEIKTAKNEIEECYSSTLLRAYKITDPSTEYEGFNNLCTLNNNPGKEITVSKELYEILKDAYEKTCEQRGYSVFAGNFYSHWNSILSLTEPSEFDPLNNSDEAERLSALAEMSSDLNGFSLIFKENNVVVFDYKEEYKKSLEKNEETPAILDLNLLRESYMIDMAKKALNERGFSRGLITTDRGLLLDLGTYDCGGYKMYSVDGESLVYEDTVKVPSDGAMSGICALPFEKGAVYFYTIEKDGEIHYRNPFAELNAAGFTKGIMSSYVCGSKMDAADVMFVNVGINSNCYDSDLKPDDVEIYTY